MFGERNDVCRSQIRHENDSPVFQIRFPFRNLFLYIYIYIGNQKEGYRKNNGRGNLDPACQISFSFFFFDPHVLFTFFDDETKRTYSFVLSENSIIKRLNASRTVRGYSEGK